VSFIRSALERRSLTSAVEKSLQDGTYGMPGTGKWSQGMVWNPWSSSAVSVESAMRLSAVYACLRLLSEAISTLPLDVFTRTAGTRQPAQIPPYLAFDQPGQSRIEYLSSLMLSVLTDGNAFVATPRDSLGVPTDLVVLDPSQVDVGRKRGRPVFTVEGEQFGPLDIMHVKGMTLPGQIRGVSPIRAAREVVDGARKAQEFGGNFFANSAVPPVVIKVPPGAPGQAEADSIRAKRIAQTWNETHGGAANSGKVGVLIGGAELSTVAVTPEDAQWLDTRRFGVQEIARIFGVPPHLIADSSNSTSWGSGLAEQNLAFGQLSLRPWLERIDEAHTHLLWTHGRRSEFSKLNIDALLRSSITDRYASYQVGINAGFLDVNEVRALEDLPPKGDGGETMNARALSEALQKIYLAVGKVVSADEAREILNRDGAGLTGPAPEPAPGGAPA
jgi:HK97 family phage portal protein